MRPGLAVVLSCMLVIFFGLHAVQVGHEHFGATASPHGSDTIVADDGVFHAAEKKLFLFLLLFLMSAHLWSVSSFRRFLLWHTQRECERSAKALLCLLRQRIIVYTPVRFSLLRILFSQGILHSKTH